MTSKDTDHEWTAELIRRERELETGEVRENPAEDGFSKLRRSMRGRESLSLLKRLFTKRPWPWTDSLDVDANELIRQSQTEAKRFNHTLVDVEHLVLAIREGISADAARVLTRGCHPAPTWSSLEDSPYSPAFQGFLDFVIDMAPARLVQGGDLWHGLFSCLVDEIRQSVAFLGLDEQWFKS